MSWFIKCYLIHEIVYYVLLYLNVYFKINVKLTLE